MYVAGYGTKRSSLLVRIPTSLYERLKVDVCEKEDVTLTAVVIDALAQMLANRGIDPPQDLTTSAQPSRWSRYREGRRRPVIDRRDPSTEIPPDELDALIGEI